MREEIDNGLIERNTTKFTKRSFILLGLSILAFVLLVILLIGFDNELGSNGDIQVVIFSILSVVATSLTLLGLLQSIKAFKKPREEGLLKYYAILSNGLLSVFLGLFSLGQGYDLYLKFFM